MLLSTISLAFASLASCAVLTDPDNLPDNELVWRGPLHAGGNDVYLSGKDIQDIYAQILNLNPSYNATELPTETPAATALESSKLTKRDWITCNPQGEQIPRAGFNCMDAVTTLMNSGGSVRAPRGHGGCTVASCSHQCGISLCNDNTGFEIWVPMSNLAGDYRAIGDTCAEVKFSVLFLKGQVFRDQYPGWNTIVKKHYC